MNETLYSGIAIGGPMEGHEVEGRFPGGILFVDKANNKCWLYDYFEKNSTTRFYLRPLGYDAFWDEMTFDQKLEVIKQTTLEGLDATRDLEYEKRIQAAKSSNTEVRALPEAGVS